MAKKTVVSAEEKRAKREYERILAAMTPSQRRSHERFLRGDRRGFRPFDLEAAEAKLKARREAKKSEEGSKS